MWFLQGKPKLFQFHILKVDEEWGLSDVAFIKQKARSFVMEKLWIFPNWIFYRYSLKCDAHYIYSQKETDFNFSIWSIYTVMHVPIERFLQKPKNS